MRKPLIFSLAFHLLLILVAIFGLPRFSQRADPISAVQVSLVAAADLDTPGPITPAPVVSEPDPVPVPDPKPIPEPAAPDPGPVTEVETAPPPPVERVAPTPEVESPLPEGPTLVPPRTDVPSPEPEPIPEEQEPAAPEEASPEIVTEAVETVEDQTLAVQTAPRPAPRPTRPVRVEPEPTPEPTPEPEPQPEPEPEPEPVDPIAAAVAAALSETQTTPATSTATGPPLTGQERDSLRLAVSQCWNLGSSSTEALRVTVTVGMDMQTDGKPVASSIRMIDFDGGSRDAANIAFDAARRAILRCQSTGYPLPAEKYDQWKQIEMTFNPERMRQR